MFLENTKRDRSNYIGGSDIAVILGESPYKTPYELWLEKTGKIEPEDISEKFHVKRGSDNEPVALVKLESMLGVRFEPNKFFRGDYKNYMGCEVDGWHTDFIVEIKCMGKQAHLAVKEGVVPNHYRLQCQWNMMMSEVKSCVFASYSPEDGSLHTITLEACANTHYNMFKAAETFYELNVLQDIEPELTERDFHDMEKDQTFKQLAENYKDLLAKKKDAEESLSAVKKELDKLLKAHSITKAKCSGLVFNKFLRKGSVDYAAIPELKEVNLESYRKKAINVFDIRLKK